jgi:hypothetical protein
MESVVVHKRLIPHRKWDIYIIKWGRLLEQINAYMKQKQKQKLGLVELPSYVFESFQRGIFRFFLFTFSIL